MRLFAGHIKLARVRGEAHSARIARYGNLADDSDARRIEQVNLVRSLVGYGNPPPVWRQDGGFRLGADLKTFNNLTLGDIHDGDRRVVLIDDVKPVTPVEGHSFRIEAGRQ